jgi:uncharacterized membrane protein YhaH (DUF805 family)
MCGAHSSKTDTLHGDHGRARFHIRRLRDMLRRDIASARIEKVLSALQDINWPHLLFDTRGRIGRASWWMASCVLMVIGFAVLSAIGKNIVLAVVLALLGLLVVYSLLAVAVKRLHDRNKRGWWVLLFALAPIMLASIASAFGEGLDPILDYAAWAVVLVLALWALLELGLVPGTAGLNRYGPDPLARLKGDPRQSGSAA